MVSIELFFHCKANVKVSLFYGPFSFSRELLNQRCQAKFVFRQTGERSCRLQVQTRVYSRLFAVAFGMRCQSYYRRLKLIPWTQIFGLTVCGPEA